MKTRIMAILLVVLTAFSFTACSAGKSTTGDRIEGVYELVSTSDLDTNVDFRYNCIIFYADGLCYYATKSDNQYIEALGYNYSYSKKLGLVTLSYLNGDSSYARVMKISDDLKTVSDAKYTYELKK